MVVTDKELAAKVATACRILAKEGHTDMTAGHVSGRSPGSQHLYMKPNGLGLEEVTPEDVIVIDLDGNKVGGSERRRHVEYPIHTEIYRRRDEIDCVIHTHAPYAVAFGSVGGRLKPISHEGVPFLDLPIFDETSTLIKTVDQGRAVAACLGASRGVLLRNHGLVVVGSSVEEATIYAIVLEKAIKVQLLAGLMGDPGWSSEEETKLKMEEIYHPGNVKDSWDYYVRQLA